MKEIQLRENTVENWAMRFVEDGDYETLIDEDCKVIKPDGTPLLILLKGAVDKKNLAATWAAIKNYNPKTENRSVASGIEATYRTKKNGEKSKVRRAPKGWEVVSGIVGSFERTIRMPYAHHCAWNAQDPQRFKNLFPMAQQISRLFEQHVPDRWAMQKACCDKTDPAWVIPETVYTTITINKNFRTACHRDAGDLSAGFSAMACIRQGQFNGANLVFPNFGVAAKLDTYDLILFDPHELHGNTQLIPLTEDAVRCTLVYYFRERLLQCKSPAEELAFAKNRVLGQPLW